MSLYQDACRYIPGGVNSPVRAFRGVGGEPIFIARARGAHIESADGRRFIDYVGSWGPMILGHADPRVIRAVQEKAVDGLPLKMKMTDFVADFAFNSTEKKVFSKTAEHANPAIRLAVDERSSVQSTPWVFYHYPDLFEIKDSAYQFEFIGYQPKKLTGLQIARNPGINMVWIGCTMLVVGMTLSSLIYHRRLWAKIIPGESGVTLHLGGTTHKSQIDFQKEFRKLTEKINAQA